MNRVGRAVVMLFALAAPLYAAAIEGVVKGADGRPAGGLLVAAIPSAEMDQDRYAVAGTVTTDASGHYRIPDLDPGKYAVTVASPTQTAAFAEPRMLADGQTLTVDLTLGGEGRKFAGQITDPDGRPVRARIVAARYSSFDGDLFVLDSGADGRFTVMLPPAPYNVLVTAPGGRFSANYSLEKDDQDVQMRLERSFAEPPAEAIAWIKRAAIPLKTPEAGHGLEDMEPLARIVGNARIVALGEATHGTREFFQLKHRMLEFLVERMGFTVFGIEASTPDTVPVNEYVLHGRGDVGAAVQGMGFWTWDTLEVVEMAKWMRRYNEDPKHARKLKFVGFDMQNPASSVRRLTSYLGKVDAEYAKQAETDLAPLGSRAYAKDAAAVKKLRSALDAIAARLEQSRVAYTGRSSAAEWKDARRQIDLLRQGDRMFVDGQNYRDVAMADNVKWTLEQEPAGTKMVLWAHNAHVATEANSMGGITPMGAHLRTAFKDEMRVFGFAFDRGAFRAVAPKGGLTDFVVANAPPDTLDAALAKAGHPLFAIDLRTASGKAKEWLDSLVPARSIGAVFVPANQRFYFVRAHPARMYDAVFFVADTTAAKARTPSGPPPTPPKAKAENLDFEEGAAGEKPRGWTFPKAAEEEGFIATTVDAGCLSGKLCAWVRRDGPTTARFASLAQRIDATPYRGKKVRFRAKVRSVLVGAEATARLWFRVDLPKNRLGFFDNMQDRLPGPLPEWTQLEITGDVAPDAEAIAFGLLFTGAGSVWIDDATIEVLP